MERVTNANREWKVLAEQRRRERELRYMPSRFGARSTSYRVVLIIGGQTLASGQPAVTYAAAVTPAAVYDPDVDTVLPAGLGTAWLYTDGVVGANRVLVRYDDTPGTSSPLLAGARRMVAGTVSLAFGLLTFPAYTLKGE